MGAVFHSIRNPDSNKYALINFLFKPLEPFGTNGSKFVPEISHSAVLRGVGVPSHRNPKRRVFFWRRLKAVLDAYALQGYLAH